MGQLGNRDSNSNMPVTKIHSISTLSLCFHSSGINLLHEVFSSIHYLFFPNLIITAYSRAELPTASWEPTLVPAAIVNLNDRCRVVTHCLEIPLSCALSLRPFFPLHRPQLHSLLYWVFTISLTRKGWIVLSSNPTTRLLALNVIYTWHLSSPAFLTMYSSIHLYMADQNCPPSQLTSYLNAY